MNVPKIYIRTKIEYKGNREGKYEYKEMRMKNLGKIRELFAIKREIMSFF